MPSDRVMGIHLESHRPCDSYTRDFLKTKNHFYRKNWSSPLATRRSCTSPQFAPSPTRQRQSAFTVSPPCAPPRPTTTNGPATILSSTSPPRNIRFVSHRHRFCTQANQSTASRISSVRHKRFTANCPFGSLIASSLSANCPHCPSESAFARRSRHVT